MASVLDRPRQDEQFPDDDGPPPMWARRDLKSRLITYLRRALSLLLVVARHAARAAIWRWSAYHQSATLSVGEIRMSISPGHRGALDVYVPLVDWGARFEAIRAPIRIRVDLQTVNRGVAHGPRRGQVARRRPGPRRRPSDALTTYLMRLIALTVARRRSRSACWSRSRSAASVPRLRWTAPLAIIVALGIGVALVAADPAPRRDLQPAVLRPRPGHPARAGGGRGGAAHAGRARPGARRAARRPRPPGGRARPPAEPRRPADDHGRLRPAQQHGRRSACSSGSPNGGPVFFVGDLTDRGSPLETQPRPARRAHAASRSCSSPATTTPTTSRASSRGEGAIVLTRDGPDEARTGRPTGRSSTRSRACASRATTTRSSAARAESFKRPLRQHARPGRAGRVPAAGCSR